MKNRSRRRDSTYWEFVDYVSGPDNKVQTKYKLKIYHQAQLSVHNTPNSIKQNKLSYTFNKFVSHNVFNLRFIVLESAQG